MSKDHVRRAHEVDAGARALSKEAPGLMRAFAQVMTEANKAGALDPKVKELMALAISIAVGCEGCIAFHTRASHKKGATREEVLETIGIAVEMGGGPATVYGAEALDAYDQFASQAGG
jgi:AhpD family alkylhydroperoxidase